MFIVPRSLNAITDKRRSNLIQFNKPIISILRLKNTAFRLNSRRRDLRLQGERVLRARLPRRLDAAAVRAAARATALAREAEEFARRWRERAPVRNVFSYAIKTM